MDAKRTQPVVAVPPEGVRSMLASELTEARERTTTLLASLSDDDLMRQHSPLMSPLVWDLAHIGWYEELWLCRKLTGAPATDSSFDEIYDAFGNPRAGRVELPLLEPARARAYCAAVRSRTLDTLEGIELDAEDPLLADGFIYQLVAQHEQQHIETMLATLQLRDGAYECPPPPPEAGPIGSPQISVDGDRSIHGTDDVSVYDNERAAHEVELQPFLIDAAPVTNAQFVEFIDSGGYDDRAAWSDEGWEHRTIEQLEHPLFWSRQGDGSWSVRRFGHVIEVRADEPVQHVSWYEADAFARWAGKRLPTEYEWEKAASWDARRRRKHAFPWGGPYTDGYANLGGRHFQPAPIGAYPSGAAPLGAHHTIGDVWEWTSSDFHGYEGFEPFPYPEYSQVFFGSEYKVLRGGSWATHPSVARTTFRNWDLPQRRQIFAGFRCAQDIDLKDGRR